MYGNVVHRKSNGLLIGKATGYFGAAISHSTPTDTVMGSRFLDTKKVRSFAIGL